MSAQIEKKINKSVPRVICTDDFFTRKRHTHGTVMVDAEIGQIVDILESF